LAAEVWLRDVVLVPLDAEEEKKKTHPRHTEATNLGEIAADLQERERQEKSGIVLLPPPPPPSPWPFFVVSFL
jgi:hypothetical protein